MALRLQSSVHGKIRRLLMVEESGLTPEERESFLQVLLQVYLNRSNHTQIIVWSETLSESKSLESWFRLNVQQIDITNDPNDSNPSKLLMLSPTGNRRVETSRWVRDPFLVFVDSANSLSIMALSRNGQYRIARELIKVGLFNEARYTELFSFAGGDVIAVGGLVLVGQSTIYDSEKHLFGNCKMPSNVKRMRILSMIAERLDIGVDKIVPIVLPENESIDFFNKKNWCCSQKQPLKNRKSLIAIDTDLIHIDIFISPTGEMKNSKPLILLATLIDLNTNDTQRIKELNDKLDIIELLLSAKFEIIRNKVPCVRLKNGNWTFLFYNNCIVENSEDVKLVWLPDYLCHLDSLDMDENIIELLATIQTENINFWTDLKFNKVLIKADFVPFLTEKGALHCLTKELLRDSLINI